MTEAKNDLLVVGLLAGVLALVGVAFVVSHKQATSQDNGNQPPTVPPSNQLAPGEPAPVPATPDVVKEQAKPTYTGLPATDLRYTQV